MNRSDTNDNPILLLRQAHRWRMAFFGLVILLAGITLGVAGTLLCVGPAEGQPPMEPAMVVNAIVGRFRGELGITREQDGQIRRILQTRMGKLHEIRVRARPEIEEQLQEMKEEIAAVLTDAQRSRWEGIMERLDEEFHRGMRRGPGGPGAGFRGGRDGIGPPVGPVPRPGGRGQRWRPPEGTSPSPMPKNNITP